MKQGFTGYYEINRGNYESCFSKRVSNDHKYMSMKIEMQPGEIKIDTWAILYIPPGGGKYNGKLTITNKRLLYDPRYDIPDLGMPVDEQFSERGKEGYLVISKSDIRDVQVEKSLLCKKAIVTLADNSRHTFNYGVLNVDKVAEAILSN